jgi:hypothetical protein
MRSTPNRKSSHPLEQTALAYTTQRKSHLGLRRHLLLLAPHPRRPFRRPHPPRYSRLRAISRSPRTLEQARRRTHRYTHPSQPHRRRTPSTAKRTRWFRDGRSEGKNRQRRRTHNPRPPRTRRKLRYQEPLPWLQSLPARPCPRRQIQRRRPTFQPRRRRNLLLRRH